MVIKGTRREYCGGTNSLYLDCVNVNIHVVIYCSTILDFITGKLGKGSCVHSIFLTTDMNLPLSQRKRLIFKITMLKMLKDLLGRQTKYMKKLRISSG